MANDVGIAAMIAEAKDRRREARRQSAQVFEDALAGVIGADLVAMLDLSPIHEAGEALVNAAEFEYAGLIYRVAYGSLAHGERVEAFYLFIPGQPQRVRFADPDRFLLVLARLSNQDSGAAAR